MNAQDTPRSGPSRPAEIPTAVLTLGVGAIVAFMLWSWGGAKVAASLGDTDDALRLLLVRDLIGGHAGWWDQHLARLQPPLGMDLHWSRLIDGGIVAVESFFRLFMDPAHAELAARTAWPFLWLFPAIAAALSIARSLRGPVAAVLCAILLAVNFPLYAQWLPGRIDHHDVQIALCLVALAGAVRGGRGGSAVAGATTGLALAIGIEGLIFEALMGAAVALRFLVDPAGEQRPTRAYAAALAVTIVPLYLIETPPWRWGVPVCDTIGLNLAAGVVVACAGVFAATRLAGRSLAVRCAGVALAGLAAAGVYVALLPACIHGPLAQADPRLWPVWLSHITEMRSLFIGFPDLGNSYALSQMIFQTLGLAAWLWLGRNASRRTISWGLLGVCLIAGIAAEAQAQRMAFYPAWFATALVAAGVAELGAARLRGRLAPMAALAFAASPTWASAAIAALHPTGSTAFGAKGAGSCTSPEDFRRLAQLPAGVVLGSLDLGPYVLVTTSHSVIAAPYHRMAWGILAADETLRAPPAEAEPAVRRLQVDYVLACPARSRASRRIPPPQSLQADLDRGAPPSWLEPLSPREAALQIYRVRSSTAIKAGAE